MPGFRCLICLHDFNTARAVRPLRTIGSLGLLGGPGSTGPLRDFPRSMNRGHEELGSRKTRGPGGSLEYHRPMAFFGMYPCQALLLANRLRCFAPGKKNGPLLFSFSPAMASPAFRWDAYVERIRENLEEENSDLLLLFPVGNLEHPAGCSPGMERGRGHGWPLTVTSGRRTRAQNWLVSGPFLAAK